MLDKPQFLKQFQVITKENTVLFSMHETAMFMAAFEMNLSKERFKEITEGARDEAFDSKMAQALSKLFIMLLTKSKIEDVSGKVTIKVVSSNVN